MKRLLLFPDTVKIENDALTVAGQDLSSLADKYGTPLYLYDRATMDSAVTDYKRCLASFYTSTGSGQRPGLASVIYAGKAYLCTAIAQWTQQQDLWLDCTGEGEIGIAKAGGVSSNRLLVHGVNKSDADIKSALEHAGIIVVDNLTELSRLAKLFPTSNTRFPNLWLRLQPGLSVKTHAYTQTGQLDSKFGMDGEELMDAALICREQGLPLSGLHFHQGSQFRDPAPLKPAIELALDIAKQIGFSGDWNFSPGGGWGVAYHEDELPHPEIEIYIKLIARTIIKACKKLELSLPHLHIEPGRSLVARAGVALYRVNTVKRQGGRTWLLVDGGLADNPRHALYGARYSCLPVAGVSAALSLPSRTGALAARTASKGRERGENVHIAGPFCETGDVIIEDLPMPNIADGELIAVPMSGAYQLSMSSNYNGARRPAVLWLEGGQAKLIQRRETTDDLLRRDFHTL